VIDVTVRKRLDQLTSEPAVGDLGYPADQRQMAGAMLGLQLLAGEIDEIKSRLKGLGTPIVVDAPRAGDSLADVELQLCELTDQLRKLTKAVKKTSKGR
jgi:hypothetical protein